MFCFFQDSDEIIQGAGEDGDQVADAGGGEQRLREHQHQRGEEAQPQERHVDESQGAWSRADHSSLQQACQENSKREIHTQDCSLQQVLIKLKIY